MMKKKHFTSLSLLTVLIWTIYMQTLGFDLGSWDNDLYIWNNHYITAINWTNIKGVFTHYFSGNYAPVQMLSYMVDFAIWKYNALGFHLTNVLLHCLGSFLLYALLLKLTRKWTVATVASLIFATHPVQVETVAWLAQRKSLLAAVFFFLSFYMYLISEERKNIYWGIGSLLFFSLSLLSKASSITMPLLLLLYIYIFKRDSLRTALYRLIPFFLVSLVFSLIAVKSQQDVTAIEMWGGSVRSNLLTVLVAVRKYIFKLLFPFHLSAYYDFTYNSISDPQVIGSILLLVIISFLVFRLFKKNSEMGYWSLWPFILMIPNLHIVPLPKIMADRYLHLPLIGPSVLAGYLVAFLLENRKRRAIITVLITLVFFATYSASSFERAKVWKNNETLWKDTALRSPNYHTLYAYGASLEQEGRLQEAELWLRKSLAMDPDFFAPYMVLGSIYSQQGDYDKSLYNLRRAVDLSEPGKWAEVWELLGQVYQKKGKLEEATDAYEKAVQIDAFSENLRSSLIDLYVRMGDLQKAGRHCEALVRINPDNFGAQHNLGMYYHQVLKNDEKALEHLDRATELNPEFSKSFYEKAMIYESRNNVDAAVSNYERFLALNKMRDASGVQAANNLAFLYAEHKPDRLIEALRLAEEANRMSPDNSLLQDTLGWVYFRLGNYEMAKEVLEKSLSRNAGNPDILLHLAKTYIRMGEKKIADKTLKKLLSLSVISAEQKTEAQSLLRK